MEPLTITLAMDLKTHDISYHVDDVPILRHVTHAFPSKQITAILGKSGSGKTTLLQILNGMIKPSQGYVSFFGQPLPTEDVPETRLGIGYVIQQAGLFPHLTIRDNIALPGKVKKLAKEYLSMRVDQLMELVELPVVYSSKYPHELSGGEQQRAALCRAMLLNPPLMLMDEPFASLDHKTKQTIYNHLLRIQKVEPRTIILVTHDWDEAMQLADGFVLLDHGQIIDHGNREHLSEARKRYLQQE